MGTIQMIPKMGIRKVFRGASRSVSFFQEEESYLTSISCGKGEKEHYVVVYGVGVMDDGSMVIRRSVIIFEDEESKLGWKFLNSKTS